MILTKGLPCYACRPGRDWADFQGLLARGDVGLTIYRYRPPSPRDGNRSSIVPREMFILYTTRNINEEPHGQMNFELYEADLPKCVNYCPRCKEMMRRIEALFSRSSTTMPRSDLCEMFSCPPCTDIVRKFRKFATDTSLRERDSELIHLQRLTASEYDLQFKINSFSNKAGLFKTAGGLKDKDGNVIYKDVCFKDKHGRVSFKDIYGSLKDEEGINKEGGKSVKDKDESVKYREGISKDRGKAQSGAARLSEKVEGKTRGGEAKTSKTSKTEETTEKEKGRRREVETSKTNNLKGNAGKSKRQDTQGTNAETSKTNNSKGTTGKAKSTEAGSSKTKEYDQINKDVKLRKSLDESSKGTKKTAGSKVTKEESKLGKRGGIQSNTSDSRIMANKTAESKSKKGDQSKPGKPGGIQSSTSDSRIRANEMAESKSKKRDQSKPGKPGGIQSSTSDSKIMANEMAESKSKKGDQSKLGKGGGIQSNTSDGRIMANEMAESKSKEGDQKSLKPVIRIKIDEYTRDVLQAHKAAEEAERRARANAEKGMQLKLNEAMQAMQLLLAAGDDGSLAPTEDVIECPQYEERQDIIRGNTIYKMRKSEAAKQEKEKPAIEQQPVESLRLPPVRPPSVQKITVQSSVSIPKREGVLGYSLSERKYISKGWTKLPKEMVMRKVPVFLMRPARQDHDWLGLNKHKKLLVYPSGESLATFEENKTLLYYRSGEVALEWYKAEDPDTYGDRVVVYSSGQPAAGRAQPRTVLAVFDYSGNGAVYDHSGHIRLKYSQSEGVVFDRTVAPHTHWKWHNLSDSQLLQTVLIENQPLIKDHTIAEYEDEDQEKPKKAMPADDSDAVMRSIEAQNVIKNTKKLLHKYVPFEIKMKAVKINEYFSLKIFEQPSIFLSFSDGKTRMKINVGMVLDPNVVVGEAFVEVGEVAGVMEKVACSESLERLQRAVQGAREAKHARVQRERRLNITPSYLFQKQQKRCLTGKDSSAF